MKKAEETKKMKLTFKQKVKIAKYKTSKFIADNPALVAVCGYVVFIGGIVVAGKAVANRIDAKNAEEAAERLAEWKADPWYYDAYNNEEIHTIRELTGEEYKELCYLANNTSKTVKAVLTEMNLIKEEA